MRLLEILGVKKKSVDPTKALLARDTSDHSSPINLAERAEDIDSPIEEAGPGFWDGAALLHVYRKQRGYAVDVCPKCHEQLINYYVGLIYGSQHGLRQNMSPCAFVCDPCDVVVLDEHLPKNVARMYGHQYTVPVGIYSLRRSAPPPDELDFFRSYEGREVIHLLDEDGFLENVIYKEEGTGLGFSAPSRPSPDAKARKAKRKAERVARKKNRRH
jgi:hypothetical protein